MQQTRRPLVEALKRCAGKGLTAFHTPGHLQGKAAPPALRQWWGRPVFEADLTEVPGLDDLHAPSGAIRKAQDLAADLAGAGRTFFLVNGSTAGIHAMLLACAGPGDKVILPRTVHRAVVAALVLSGAEPVFLPVRRLDDFDIPLPPPEAVYRESLVRNPDARALFTVYPDYYGVAVDLAALAGVAHEHGLPLLADAAHGVLFGYRPEMPAGAVACGADAVVESVHKRAGALTQAAWLHVQGNRLDRERVGQALLLLTTTSPSYLLLASLDAARRQLALSGPRICRRQVELAGDARQALSRLPGVRVLSEVHGGYRIDPTRLVLNFNQAGISGPAAAGVMYRSGVAVEMADCRNVVVLLSSAHGARDVKRMVKAAEAAAAARGRRGTICPRFPEAPPRRLTPREAWLAAAESVPVVKAPGRVSVEMVAVTPPGFPVLLPGEEVTHEVVSYLHAVRAAGLTVHGVADPELKSLRVVR
jgi:arginine/lysine/ornithine decarboxylase